jgi:hypothetical protein
MDLKEYTITVEEKPEYLYVTAHGIRSRETLKSLSLNVFNTALEKHRSKILIDIRELSGDFGFMDIFYLVKEVFQGLWGRGIDQIAVIDTHTTSRDDWFLEPVAQSHGMNIRVFTEAETARKWLLE